MTHFLYILLSSKLYSTKKLKFEALIYLDVSPKYLILLFTSSWVGITFWCHFYINYMYYFLTWLQAVLPKHLKKVPETVALSPRVSEHLCLLQHSEPASVTAVLQLVFVIHSMHGRSFSGQIPGIIPSKVLYFHDWQNLFWPWCHCFGYLKNQN